jgi:hypothetical protein
MLPRVAAVLSMVIGVWGLLAVLSIWGAAGGVVGGVLAIVLGLASRSEPTSRRFQTMATVGLAAGVLAVLGFILLLVLAAFGV